MYSTWRKYKITLRHLFRTPPEIFVPDSWYEKPAPKTDARKCSQFMAPISGAFVVGIN